MEAYRQRLHEAQFRECQIGWIQFFRRHCDIFGQRPIPLNTKGLIELASIRPTAKTSSATAAVRVRGHSHVAPGGQGRVPLATFDDRRRYLVAWNARKRNKRVQAPEGIQVASAESDHSHFQEETVSVDCRLNDRLDCRFARFLDYDRFHSPALRVLAFGLSRYTSVAVPPRMRSCSVAERPLTRDCSVSTHFRYVDASRQTGQSDPAMSRLGPNACNTTST